LHSGFLDHVGPKLVAARPISAQGQSALIRTECITFAHDNGISPAGCNLSLDELQRYLQRERRSAKPVSHASILPSFRILRRTGCDTPTPMLAWYYDQLEALLDNGLSESQFNSQVNTMMQSASYDLSSAESDCFNIAAEVSKDSYAYWRDVDSWEPYYDPEQTGQWISFGDWVGCVLGSVVDGFVPSFDLSGAIFGGWAGAGAASGTAAVLAAGGCAMA
jgi:hypothetical protein